MKRKEYKEKGYKNKFGNSRVSNTYSTNKTHTHTRVHTKCNHKESQRNLNFSVTVFFLNFLPNISNG